ncbi:MAG TPA: FAD binding domain-containing protein [Tepidisphaeraceae bacterium]|nr:FAD binding domain-containing protein [Tepidisphaeraceae bacterium]
MRNFVLIYVNGQRHELRGPRLFQSLSDFLRYELQLTGTKVVCAEGDCGSCTVFLGRPRGGAIEYRTVCSCIQYLYQLDGCHIVTVEGLKYDGQMNPIQSAMVRCQGTQCGFCTPGFVVSMCALFEGDGPITEHRLRRGLIGNLCRCTGYEPILKAGLAIDASQVKRLDELYPPAPLLLALAPASNDAVLVQDSDRTFFKPTSIADAARFKQEHADCVIISGGTDLGVQMNKGVRALRTVMSTAALEPLRELSVSNEQIVAGASVSIAELENAAAKALPEYAALLGWFGSPPIKNAGTVGGNIANASPIGDSMPAMFVLNAEIELTGVNDSRRVNINSFYTGYKKSVATADELITRVFIPLPKVGEVFKLYKVSKRKDLDISSFTAAVWMSVSDHTIGEVRIAYGGVAATIVRLPKTEAALNGQRISEALFDDAADVAVGEIKPISDVRGSADYRLRLAANVLRKFFIETFGGGSNGDGRGPNGDGNGHPPTHAKSRLSALDVVVRK